MSIKSFFNFFSKLDIYEYGYGETCRENIKIRIENYIKSNNKLIQEKKNENYLRIYYSIINYISVFFNGKLKREKEIKEKKLFIELIILPNGKFDYGEILEYEDKIKLYIRETIPEKINDFLTFLHLYIGMNEQNINFDFFKIYKSSTDNYYLELYNSSYQKFETQLYYYFHTNDKNQSTLINLYKKNYLFDGITFNSDFSVTVQNLENHKSNDNKYIGICLNYSNYTYHTFLLNNEIDCPNITDFDYDTLIFKYVNFDIKKFIYLLCEHYDIYPEDIKKNIFNNLKFKINFESKNIFLYINIDSNSNVPNNLSNLMFSKMFFKNNKDIDILNYSFISFIIREKCIKKRNSVAIKSDICYLVIKINIRPDYIHIVDVNIDRRVDFNVHIFNEFKKDFKNKIPDNYFSLLLCIVKQLYPHICRAFLNQNENQSENLISNIGIPMTYTEDYLESKNINIIFMMNKNTNIKKEIRRQIEMIQ